MSSTSIGGLSDEIVRQLKEYNSEVNEKLEASIKEVANEVKDSLKNDNTIPKSKAIHKHYRDSFYVQKVGKSQKYVIANKLYRLTHLLERGHLTRNGKRTRAYPHWERANKLALEKVLEIKKQLEG